jgi:hypothetical protein
MHASTYATRNLCCNTLKSAQGCTFNGRPTVDSKQSNSVPRRASSIVRTTKSRLPRMRTVPHTSWLSFARLASAPLGVRDARRSSAQGLVSSARFLQKSRHSTPLVDMLPSSDIKNSHTVGFLVKNCSRKPNRRGGGVRVANFDEFGRPETGGLSRV